MNAAVYNFQTAEELQILLHSALYKYAGSSSALEWIEKLITDQTKVSRAHTAKHFTAKTVASSRAEGSNSRIKEWGAKKAELRKFNLFQFLQYYINMVERQEAESLNIIEKLIQDRREYSDFVKDIWESEHRLSYQHSCTKIVDDNGDSATVWKVISTRGSCHLVRLDSNCSSCECVSFRSTLIPCRHICCFAISMQIDPFNVR
jgi:hypothetical protein